MDTYTDAWPILRRHGVPALVFLPSGYIGTGEVFWQERLGHLLDVICSRASVDPTFAERAKQVLSQFGLETILELEATERRPAILELVRAQKALDTTGASAVTRALAPLAEDEGGTVPAVDRFMNWEQAREMARDGISFGAHGETHRPLTALTADEVRREVAASRDAVTQGVGLGATAFCYPNGDWSDAVAETVQEAGFRLAFTTARGRVGSRVNPMALHRVNVHEDMTGDPAMFLARVIGVV
jgi:peptidoglycan/xylan/chitin deacetylase (PgdA/CDA1 family)